jgi:hypothetical protein
MVATEHERLSSIILEHIERTPSKGFERTAKAVLRALEPPKATTTMALLETRPGRARVSDTVRIHEPLGEAMASAGNRTVSASDLAAIIKSAATDAEKLVRIGELVGNATVMESRDESRKVVSPTNRGIVRSILARRLGR